MLRVRLVGEAGIDGGSGESAPRPPERDGAVGFTRPSSRAGPGSSSRSLVAVPRTGVIPRCAAHAPFDARPGFRIVGVGTRPEPEQTAAKRTEGSLLSGHRAFVIAQHRSSTVAA